MKRFRTLLLCLTIALAASLAIGSTLAYMTDKDVEVNTFTMGSVNIDVLEEFEQDSQLMPGKEIPKKVWIKNTGDNNAWVWYFYAVPANLDAMLEIRSENTGVDGAWIDRAPVFANPVPEQSNLDFITVELGGVEYKVYAALHKNPLPAGQETLHGMVSVKLMGKVDYRAETDTYVLVEDGVEKASAPAAALKNAKIIVMGFAVQEEGFAQANGYDVFDAVDAYFGQWGDPATVLQSSIILTPETDAIGEQQADEFKPELDENIEQ